MKNIKLKTKGMHCTSCEMLLKDALEEQIGVKKIDANHKTGLVSIKFDESLINIDVLEAVIRETGYEVAK